MNPLIPKILIGDVLQSTRHLRTWFHLSSMVARLRTVMKNGEARVSIYSPSKEEKYVVAGNNNGCFAVWNPDNTNIVLFRNFPAAKNMGALSATNFSYWFSRTTERRVDLGKWPSHAKALRANIQFNLFNGDLPNLGGGNFDRMFPFVGHRNLWGGGEGTFLQHARGNRERVFRPEQKSLQGPHVEDLGLLAVQLADLLEEPRTQKWARDSGENLRVYLQALEAHRPF